MSNLRVLVVDQDPELLSGLQLALAEEGFDAEGAPTGQAGLQAANDDIPDLIICEVELPDMSGWNFIRQLRAGPQFAFVPVIFLSQLADETVRVRGFRLGADDVIAKPIEHGDMALRVARVLADSYRIEHAVRAASEEASAEPPDDKKNQGMRGTLDEVGISTLLSIFEVERVGGILTVTNSDTGQIGRIYLRGGQILRARMQGTEVPKNSEAIYAVLRWSAGHFAFRSAYIAGDNETGASSMHLLIEGARRLDDETRAIRKRTPDEVTLTDSDEELEPLSQEEALRMLERSRERRRRSSQSINKKLAQAAQEAGDEAAAEDSA